jgi:cytoskeletal protein RodZ
VPTWGWIVIGVAVAAVVVLGLLALLRTRRTQNLKQQFGPEYDRTVEGADSRRAAEADLQAREERHRELDLRDLDPAEAQRYREEWQRTQSEFVDDPASAITGADLLIQRVMRDRGYPVEDFEQRAADLSVEHPDVVSNYRSAHATAVSCSQGQATTEDLRMAMRRYRSLFDELVGTGVTVGASR